MTDYEKVKQLFSELNITMTEDFDTWDTQPKVIVIVAKDGENKGYDGFYTQFSFNEDGSFINVGSWE